MSKATQKNLDYKKFIVDPRLQYFKPYSKRIEKTFAEEISASLGSTPKFIAPKFFYDLRGSDLFEKICGLPEYYLTRTETALLKKIQAELSGHLDENCRLVELGSGTSVKTRILLDILKPQIAPEYIPIDISDILAESSEQLLAHYDRLRITGIIDTYEGGLDFLKRFDQKKNLIIFLGSSYGNFEPSEGRSFLRHVRYSMRPGDLFLIGLDLVKDRQTLESAYNDSQGVTAKFNLNVLSRINNELGANFDLENFKHRAAYNEKEQRIEMHVKSLADQSVRLCGSKIDIVRDELIHTEHSYKFRPDEIHTMMRDAGFEVINMWHDDKKYFSHTLVSR